MSRIGEREPCHSVFFTTMSPKLLKYPVKLIYDRIAVNSRAYLALGTPFGAPGNTLAAVQVRGWVKSRIS